MDINEHPYVGISLTVSHLFDLPYTSVFHISIARFVI